RASRQGRSGQVESPAVERRASCRCSELPRSPTNPNPSVSGEAFVRSRSDVRSRGAACLDRNVGPSYRPSLVRVLLRLAALAVLLFALPAAAKARGDRTADGRLRLEYWDKWSGFEMDAMRAVVDDFNASQQRIFVDFVSVSGIKEKTLIAAAGGHPPDIAGVWATDVIDYADKQAVIPLDDMARGNIVSREHFLPIYFDMGVYEGRLYGSPSTPGTTALHYNKRLFREAGLDPERPPRTIAELDEYATKKKNG